jgi:hypothetical protein
MYSAQLGRLSIARSVLYECLDHLALQGAMYCSIMSLIVHQSYVFSCLQSRRYNWDSVPRQLESVKALVQHDFLHIFPGHGRQLHFDSLDDRTQRIHELLVAEGAAGLL